MPTVKTTMLGEISKNVARNVRSLRRARGWSIRHFAQECTRLAGVDIRWNSLSNVERGVRQIEGSRRPRLVSADELFLFARVFDVSVEAMAGRAACEACNDMPPPGYACNICRLAAESVDEA